MLESGLSPIALSGQAGQCLGSVILESGMLQVSSVFFWGVLLLVLLITTCPAESRSWAGFVIAWLTSRIFVWVWEKGIFTVLLWISEQMNPTDSGSKVIAIPWTVLSSHL